MDWASGNEQMKMQIAARTSCGHWAGAANMLAESELQSHNALDEREQQANQTENVGGKDSSSC